MAVATTLAIANAGLQLYGQRQKYQAEVDAYEQSVRQKREQEAESMSGYLQESADLAAQRMETVSAFRQRMRDSMRQSQTQQSQVRAAQAESGARGPSMEGERNMYETAAQREQTRISSNLENSLNQISREKQSLWNRHRKRVAELAPGSKPSSTAHMLNMASTITSAGAQVQSMQA